MGAEVALLTLWEHLKEGFWVYDILIDGKYVDDYVSKENIWWHFDVIVSIRFNFFQSHQTELGTSEVKPKEERGKKNCPSSVPRYGTTLYPASPLLLQTEIEAHQLYCISWTTLGAKKSKYVELKLILNLHT